MKWNLGNRIMVLTGAMVVTVAAITSAISYFKGRAMLDGAVKTQLQQLCASTLSQVETWVDGQQQYLSLTALQPEMLAALRSGAEAATNRV